MKFQISPWKTIRTSGSFSRRETDSKENTKSRSSSLNSKNGSAAVTNADEIVGLTFHSKKRGHTPVLTITRTKQISSLEEADNGDGLAETVLYACRTGKAASFTIPAVRSAELGGIFALQSGNKQLVFLPPSHQDNGNSQHKQIAVDLESPAIELHLLSCNVHSSTVTKGTPMVFGVCKDGRVFLASISSSSLQIQYLGHNATSTTQASTPAVVSNVCQLDLRGIRHDHQQSNNKRQRDGRAVMEETGICILKSTGKAVELVSYIWNDSFRIGGSAVRTNARPLSPKYIPTDLKGVVLLGSLTSDIVCIRVADSVLSVSRHDGRLVSRPLPVPGSSKCIAMAGSGTVAILLQSTSKNKLLSSSDELLFVDVRRDMVVGKETLVAASHGQALTLVTDPRENRIAVISKLSDTVTMILSSEIMLVGEVGSITTLAAALESAIEIDHPVRPRKKGTSKQCHIADGMYHIGSENHKLPYLTLPVYLCHYSSSAFRI
jgi:hypothetical protein